MKLPFNLRGHRRVMAAGISDAIAYRGSFLLQLVTGLIPLAASLLLWLAIYRGGGPGLTIAGFDLNGMLSYYLVMNVLRLTGVLEDAQWEVTEQIRNGQLNNSLLRPINYVLLQWDLRMTSVMISAALTIIPAGVLFFLAHSILVVPHAAWQWAAFALSVVLGIQIAFLLSICVGMTAFWFLETSGIMWTIFPVQMMLSGSMFPLELVPKRIFALINLLPWTYETYFPLRIYLGRVTPAEAALGFGMQAFWVAALAGIVALMWRRGIRKYGAVGG